MSKKHKRTNPTPTPGGPSAPAPEHNASTWTRWIAWAVLAVAGLLAIWALLLMSSRESEARKLAEAGWRDYGAVIVANKVRALWHAAFMFLCAGGFLWLMCGRRRTGDSWWSACLSRIVPWLLVVLVAGDAWLLSRHYVKAMPMAALRENEVVTLLKQARPERRVALVSQEGFYNWWLTFLFPYHGIPTLNITQMPRMPADYRSFLGAVGRNPLRLWQLGAVGYVLAPADVWVQMQKDPALSGAFEPALRYNVAPRGEEGVEVLPAAGQQPAQHVVLRFLKPAPRYALIGACREAGDEETLRLLSSPGHALFQEVLVAPQQSAGTPRLTAPGAAGRVQVVRYRPGRVELDVQAERDAILRVADRFEPHWRAMVDGRVAPVLRVDFIFQGVPVGAGRHRVVLEYAPPAWPLAVQGSGMLACAAAALSLLFGRRRPTA